MNWLRVACLAAVSALLFEPSAPGQAVTVAVDASLDRRPVSPLIFGVSFGSAAQALRIHWPVRRWGGNSTTRYSWQDDISNHASDWFFYNIEDGNPNPAALPDGSTADRFVDETRAGGGAPLITVPLIGWTPVDRIRRWGFSVSKYGAQQQTECTASGGASWCQPDAGNGVKPDGTTVTGNDPHDTSREIGPPFVTGWMAHLAARTGTSGGGGVRFWALDNEPMLWNSTHRDVHPQPTTYDELWQKTRDMAAAMKAQDPGAILFGPALWGWCAYFFSAADGCAPGADRAAHGNAPFLPWYLAQAATYEAQHGVRLVDYADIHYYPQAGGVSLSGDESAATSALRLRSLKSLYDPGYVDESWIGQPVRLIPRMREWIAANYPGTKIAINEYNWGNDDGISSTLAQAEALAIFGREGVDFAARWVAPADGSRMEDAFLLYLNYDGQGSQAIGTSVRAISSNVDVVGSYAFQAGPSRLFLLLFNKDTAARPVTSTIVGGGSSPVRLFSFDVSHRLQASGTASLESGVLTLDLPARSATLAEITVNVDPGTGPFSAPTLTSPASGEVLGLAAVTATWNAVGGASGYDLRLWDGTSGATVFTGSLVGNGSTSTLLTLPHTNGSYVVGVRACGGGAFTDAACGMFATRNFSLNLVTPTGAPTITFPAEGSTLTASTQALWWTAVAKADPSVTLSCEVLLTDIAGGNKPELQITVPEPGLSTIYSLHSSSHYELKVRACQAACGPWSQPVNFAVSLPSVPSSAPSVAGCSVAGGNSLTCNWNSVANADLYQIYVVQPPPAGPGGGALTVAARVVSQTTVTLPVPSGVANVIVAACNGDGCGSFSTPFPINPAGPNPTVASLGTPLGGSVVSGPTVMFSWNRVPGDDGSNTIYRLFVQDLSRQSTALDIYTTQNFWAAYFKAEGARYDALVVVNLGPNQIVGPAQGFNVSGTSASAPTMVSPGHQSSVKAGNVQLGWSPVLGAGLYQYYLAAQVPGGPVVTGVTPGLIVQVPLAMVNGTPTLYSGITRACPAGVTCTAASDAGWGPWSNVSGGPGVTNFTVTP